MWTKNFNMSAKFKMVAVNDFFPCYMPGSQSQEYKILHVFRIYSVYKKYGDNFQYGLQIQNGGGNIALINNTCLIFTQISRAKNSNFCMYLECIRFIRNLDKNVKYSRQNCFYPRQMFNFYQKLQRKEHQILHVFRM